MGQEIWKDIIGYEGLYQISNLGRVKSLKRVGRASDRILSPVNNRGYFIIRLFKSENILSKKTFGRAFLVHRLVAIHFIENPNNYEVVNHLDFNKQNNCVSNLEWTTNIQNLLHYFATQELTSKYLGVYYDKSKNGFKSYIRYNGKKKYLGIYKNQEEAYAARVKYEKDNGIENKYL